MDGGLITRKLRNGKFEPKKGQNACRCKAFMPNLSLLLNLQVKWNFM